MIRIVLPLRTVSALNVREHWAARKKRVTMEREAFKYGALAQLGVGWAKRVALPCVVTFVRVGPRLLDSDAVPGTCKAVRDQLAVELGVGDGPTDPIEWRYLQRKAKDYSVEIEIESVLAGEEWCG